jgi:hypothetical protein
MYKEILHILEPNLLKYIKQANKNNNLFEEFRKNIIL